MINMINEPLWKYRQRQRQERQAEAEQKAILGMIYSRAEAERQLAAAREELVALRAAEAEYREVTGSEPPLFGALRSGVMKVTGKIDVLLALIASGDYAARSR